MSAEPSAYDVADVGHPLLPAHSIEITVVVPDPRSRTGERYVEREEQGREQLLRVLRRHDLAKWRFTDTVRIESLVQSHSHPVLTLNTLQLGGADDTPDDTAMLTTYLHEQLHWFAADHVGDVADALRERYPDPQTDTNPRSSVIHLVVNWLELQALGEMIGPDEARAFLSDRPYYRWEYEMVLRDDEDLRALYERHGLVVQEDSASRMQTMRREALAAELWGRCHLTGEFRLRSGETSTEYFDKYRFESDPDLLARVARVLRHLLPDGIDALAGLELGGIPLATALSAATGIPAVFVRKEPKTYGTANLAEGGDIDGRRLVVVEDVVTTGGQVIASADALRERGAVVDTVLCVVDRGGADALGVEDLHLRALFTLDELRAATGRDLGSQTDRQSR